MTDNEQVSDSTEGMREAITAQLKDKARRDPKNHIRKSLIWNTAQGIRSIQRDLCAGATFDYGSMTLLVNTMFGFINGCVAPGQEIQGASVEVKDMTDEN